MQKVSIVIPCYNQGSFLADALDSVLNQTLPDWECIIVNDASTDNTETIARSYTVKDKRFLYIKAPQNQGLAASRNLGIRHTTAPYILPLDADDTLAPTFLEKTVAVLLHNKKCKVVYTDVQYFGERHETISMNPVVIRNFIYTNQMVCTSLFTRKAYNRTLGYRTNLLYGYEDWDLWIQMLRKEAEVVHISEPLFLYRQKAGSMYDSLRADPLKNQAMLDQLLLNNPAFFRRMDPWGFFRRWDLLTNTHTSGLIKLERKIRVWIDRLGA
jgi:GT2 family glycosyltransferase